MQGEIEVVSIPFWVFIAIALAVIGVVTLVVLAFQKPKRRK
jgi:hypothetical protein